MKTSEALRRLGMDMYSQNISRAAALGVEAHAEAVAKMEGELEAYRDIVGHVLEIQDIVERRMAQLRALHAQAQSKPVDPVEPND